jgi:nicotinamidase/pyrazinamidase
MKALILVGLQTEFITGPLAVAGGESLIPLANELQGRFRLVVATQQWHPVNHLSFALSHRGRVAGERVRVGRSEQVLKPNHCIQGTRGAELSPALNMTRVNKVIRLGTDPDIDDSSAFFDGRHQRPTGLSDFLHEKKVESVYIMGLATEQAVQATALDAMGLNFKTWVVQDACRAADTNPEVSRIAFEMLHEVGVKLTDSGRLLRTHLPKSADASPLGA